MKNNTQEVVNLDILVSENNRFSVIGCDYVDCYGNEQPIRIRKVESIWKSFNEGSTTCIPQIPLYLLIYRFDKSNGIVTSFPIVVGYDKENQFKVVGYDKENQFKDGVNDIICLLLDFKSFLFVCYKKSKYKMVIITIDNLSYIQKMFPNEYATKVPSELNFHLAIAHENTKQFIYRYVVNFIHRDNEKNEGKYMIESLGDEKKHNLDYIEEVLYDGTYDKLHDGGLMKYHQAGKPKKLRVEWHIGKSEYSAYFWFEDERIREVFDRFYGAHPDTKTDFIIRIDAEKRKYELALYRYGLKEPQVIPEDVYQLLVFKNKFEDYRSDNYNQERGAWIW